jgi:hypothetical protein
MEANRNIFHGTEPTLESAGDTQREGGKGAGRIHERQNHYHDGPRPERERMSRRPRPSTRGFRCLSFGFGEAVGAHLSDSSIWCRTDPPPRDNPAFELGTSEKRSFTLFLHKIGMSISNTENILYYFLIKIVW